MIFRSYEFGGLEVEFGDRILVPPVVAKIAKLIEAQRMYVRVSSDVERDGRLRAKRVRPHCTTRETRNRRQKLTQYRCPRASILSPVGYREPTPPHTSHSASFSSGNLFRFDSCVPCLYLSPSFEFPIRQRYIADLFGS